MIDQKFIDNLRQTADDYHEGVGAISNWCNQVSIGMGFDGCENIQAFHDGFSFVADWHGSYGAENHEAFSFDYADLFNEPAAVVKRLQRERKLAEEEKKLEQLKKDEAEQLRQYEILRKKFG